MGDDFDPLTTGEPAALVSHASIRKLMLVISIAAPLGVMAFAGWRAGVAVLLGAMLSFVNYLWLDRSTKAIFRDNTMSSTFILAAKYVLRYAFLAAVVFAIYLTGALPVVPVILGLGIFAFAVVLQGLKSIISSSF